MTEQAHARTRAMVAFQNSLDRLEQALSNKNEQEGWEAVRGALDWLYRLEEHDRSQDPGYYSRRDACVTGRTVAALIWVRGLSVHHQAEVRRKLWHRARTFIVGDDGKLIEMGTLVITDNGPMRVETQIVSTGWPKRGDLPAPPHSPDRHRRDLRYDEYVADRPLLPPLRAAENYFDQER